MTQDELCPVCQQANQCQRTSEDKTAPCWCDTMTFPAELLQQLETAEQCLCEGCLQRFLQRQQKLTQ